MTFYKNVQTKTIIMLISVNNNIKIKRRLFTLICLPKLLFDRKN